MGAPLAIKVWPLGTYLASLPGRHTVLHLHGFNHTDFLTFCYLENAQRGQACEKHSNFATTFKREAAESSLKL